METGTKVFFADPHSPWQRPSNENTNGLLRQYFPKGTDLTRWSAKDLEAVAYALNSRPRKILKWKTPAEVFEEHLLSLNQPRVASTREPAQFRSRKVQRRCGATNSSAPWDRSAPPATTPPWNPPLAATEERLEPPPLGDTRDQIRLAIVAWIERTYHGSSQSTV